MDTDKAHVRIDHAKCPPCNGLICVGVCPEGILEEDVTGKPKVADSANCTMCGVCVDLCPQKAITVTRGEKGQEKPR
jgi:NAD-dependent dihydropyrimidine dehydrogenase PreA subunit